MWGTMAMRVRAYTRAKPDIVVCSPASPSGVPRHAFTVAKKRACSLDGNPRVPDIELSVSYFFFLLRPRPTAPFRDEYSYIEIVSDISTLSFFRSRLVKYRRRVRRASREWSRKRGKRRKRIGMMLEEKAAGGPRKGR